MRTARFTVVMALAAVLASGCGEDEAPPPPAPPTYFGLEEAPGDRLVVARVDGKPVYGDCVARQAAALGLDRRDALDQCIGFELLSAEAERRGHLADRAVQETGKREAVRALVDADFVLDAPADIPEEDVKQAWQRYEGVINRPELRTSYYCRATLEHEQPDDSAAENEARRAVEALHDQLAGKVVALDEFRRACKEVVGDDEVERRSGLLHSPIQMIRMIKDDGSPKRLDQPGAAIDQTFSRAVFAIPAVNRVSEPVRVRWGWDLLYVSDIAPAVELSYEEAEPKLRERLFAERSFRQSLFMRWAKPFSRGMNIEVHPELIPEDDEALSLAGGAAP